MIAIMLSGWWSELTGLEQVFYALAGVFSLIFLWQMVSALIGLGGGASDVDVSVDADVDIDAADLDLDHIEAHSLEEAAESTASFRVFSLRAVLAFCTMFTWAGALYLDRVGKALPVALLYALGWGLAGWLVIAALIYWLRKLQESGTPALKTALGKNGRVYLDIPADGLGEVIVPVSCILTHVKARSMKDAALSAGVKVRVTGLVDASTVEVTPLTHEAE